jgi:hypothetical protein
MRSISNPQNMQFRIKPMKYIMAVLEKIVHANVCVGKRSTSKSRAKTIQSVFSDIVPSSSPNAARKLGTSNSPRTIVETTNVFLLNFFIIEALA